jgi:hypothetical protein
VSRKSRTAYRITGSRLGWSVRCRKLDFIR